MIVAHRPSPMGWLSPLTISSQSYSTCKMHVLSCCRMKLRVIIAGSFYLVCKSICIGEKLGHWCKLQKKKKTTVQGAQLKNPDLSGVPLGNDSFKAICFHYELTGYWKTTTTLAPTCFTRFQVLSVNVAVFFLLLNRIPIIAHNNISVVPDLKFEG